VRVKSLRTLIKLVQAVEEGKIRPGRRGEAKKIMELLSCSQGKAFDYLEALRKLDGLYYRIMERRLRRIYGF